jgi:hypothetical protein
METNELAIRDSINRAAYWRGDKENEPFGDIMYNSFVRLMTYRREIARAILKGGDGLRIDHLEQEFQYCNDKIKKVLGI